MPYTFPTGARALAIELGLLRKLGKARRLASAKKIVRAARRPESNDEDEEPPARGRSSVRKPRRHRA